MKAYELYRPHIVKEAKDVCFGMSHDDSTDCRMFLSSYTLGFIRALDFIFMNADEDAVKKLYELLKNCKIKENYPL